MYLSQACQGDTEQVVRLAAAETFRNVLDQAPVTIHVPKLCYIFYVWLYFHVKFFTTCSIHDVTIVTCLAKLFPSSQSLGSVSAVVYRHSWHWETSTRSVLDIVALVAPLSFSHLSCPWPRAWALSCHQWLTTVGDVSCAHHWPCASVCVCVNLCVCMCPCVCFCVCWFVCVSAWQLMLVHICGPSPAAKSWRGIVVKGHPMSPPSSESS